MNRPLDFAAAKVHLLSFEASVLVVLVVDDPDRLRLYYHRTSLN